MKKESFVKIINALLEMDTRLYRLGVSLNEFCHDTPCFNNLIESQLYDIKKALELEMNDIPWKYGINDYKRTYIDWWFEQRDMFDDSLSDIWIDNDDGNGRILLGTPEQLYDFLVAESNK